jgi:hypothetical protein
MAGMRPGTAVPPGIYNKGPPAELSVRLLIVLVPGLGAEWGIRYAQPL